VATSGSKRSKQVGLKAYFALGFLGYKSSKSKAQTLSQSMHGTSHEHAVSVPLSNDNSALQFT
jgi:hypothetical protein